MVRGAPNLNFALQIRGHWKQFLGNVLIGDGRPSKGLPSLKVRKRSIQGWGRN